MGTSVSKETNFSEICFALCITVERNFTVHVNLNLSTFILLIIDHISVCLYIYIHLFVCFCVLF